MFKLIDEIVQQFRSCFNRESTFYWFCVALFGVIVRLDIKGVTSIIGGLSLDPKYYNTLLHFFRSEAYKLENLKACWLKIVLKTIKIKEISGYLLSVGDHSKIVKEARYMPGVKKHHQDSDNSGKGEYIYGHEAGMIGFITSTQNIKCIPVDIELHDGKDEINELTKSEDERSQTDVNGGNIQEHKSIVTSKSKKKNKKKSGKESKKNGNKKKKETKKSKEKNQNKSSSAKKLINMFEKMVKRIGRAVLIVLDAGFATGDVFKKVFEINEEAGKKLAAVIVRAKSNYVGIKPVEEKEEKGVGRPRTKGESVSFYSYFKDMSQFSIVDLNIYGKLERVQYLCTDLLWNPCGKTIRIVMVKTGDLKMVLMCSDLLLSPESIITAYTYRFKIEVTFKELKHNIGCFAYHFWTRVMPKLSKFKTKTDLSGIVDSLEIAKIMATVKAIEMFTFLGCVALGIIIIISNEYSNVIWKNYSGWLKTKTSNIPSVEVTIMVVRKIYDFNKIKLSEYKTFQIISKFQNFDFYKYDEYCA